MKKWLILLLALLIYFIVSRSSISLTFSWPEKKGESKEKKEAGSTAGPAFVAKAGWL
ncbi:hypothetical protein [Paludifilum halophilum]|uniref:hypothetical protein n=1 Tax=Paludifilum halophilum TaxID=1642702 RepID=UPI00146E13E2|nr:hypothetical protein [Paludifilum halophilum]